MSNNNDHGGGDCGDEDYGDEDDEIRAYFRGKRLHSLGHRDERLREALAEVVRIATEQLPPSPRGQQSVPYEPPDDIVISYGGRHEIYERLGRKNRSDASRPKREERIQGGEDMDREMPLVSHAIPPRKQDNVPPQDRSAMVGDVFDDQLDRARGPEDDIDAIPIRFANLLGNREDNQGYASDAEDDIGTSNEEDIAMHQHDIEESPVNNPSVDFPSPELERLVTDIRSDPSFHYPEPRHTRSLGTRTPGETDSGFRPAPGDVVVRARQLLDGTFLQYYTNEFHRTAAPLQAGDRIVRTFIDNTTDVNQTRIYSELHMCLGYQGGREPQFLYFGKSEVSTHAARGG